MKDVKVPGVVWAIGIIAVIALIHANEVTIQQNIGLDAFWLDMLVAALIAILKSLSLGTAELNQALDIIDKLLLARAQAATPGTGMRSAEPAPPAVVVEEIPARPNALTRWLVG